VLSAEDFARTILVRKMEGDITRLESLNKPQAATPAWSTKQEIAPPRRKPQAAPAQGGAAANGLTDFEKRMRDALSKSAPQPDAQ
jgi:hypothetical protein